MRLEGKSNETLQADVVLVAAGIVGNVEDLGLEGTGVKVQHSHVLVDEFCRTGEPGVYAIGDLAGAPWLAHKASHEALICVEKIAGHHPHPLDPRSVPACTYSHPQVASVGYTEAQARSQARQRSSGKCIVSADKLVVDGKWSGSAYAGPSDSPGLRLWRDFLDWQRQLNALLKLLGLTQPQFAILAVCGWLTRDCVRITQHGIANFTGMDRMHISQIVSRLERDRLIEKRIDPQDQRANLLSLSKDGHHQLRIAMPIVEAFDREFFLKTVCLSVGCP